MPPRRSLTLPSLPEASTIVRALPNYLPDVHGMIKKLFKDQKFCDVELISKDETYKVNTHKLILCAASPYFMTVFNQSNRRGKLKSKKLKVPEVNGRCLKTIIDFIYNSSLTLKNNTVEDILKAAKFLQMDSLVDICTDFIGTHISPFNSISIKTFAKHYELKKLYEFTEEYIFKNILKVRDGYEFLLLSDDQLIEYISSDQLCVDSEEDVVKMVMSWVEHRKSLRKEHFERLLQHVRLLQLAPEFLTNVVKPVCESDVTYRVLYKVMKWHCLPNLRSSSALFPDSQLKPRNFTKAIIAISGWDQVDNNLNVGFYYSGKDEWMYKECPQPQTWRSNFSFTTLNEKLIIAGGILSSDYITKCVACLDMRSLLWSDMPSMNKLRNTCRLVTMNGEIFAVGGDRPKPALETIEKWNPVKNQWHHLTCLEKPLDEDFHVSAGSNMLCISQKQRSIDCPENFNFHHSFYNLKDDTWDNDWLITDENLIGTAIWNCFSTYLIVVMRDGIKKYKIDDKSCVTLECEPLDEEFTHCRLFGDRLICYGTKEFKEFDLIGNKWKTMPELADHHGESVVVSM